MPRLPSGGLSLRHNATTNNIIAAPAIDQNKNANGVKPISPAYLAKLVETPNNEPPTNRHAKGTNQAFL